ncbi:hypothetical protein VTK56DRAFT_7168 [Thermocarpiscus australiensis]
MQRLHSTYPHTAGITFLKGIEYLEVPGPEYLALSTPNNPTALQLPGFRLLTPAEFPPDGKVTWGCEYDTWCVNPMVYCSFLLRRFVHRGGKLLKRELRHPAEAFSVSSLLSSSEPPPPSSAGTITKTPITISAVVNASGTGLVPDPNVSITRGQTVLVAEPCDATVTRQNADGSWTFCVPRGFDGGTVVGGTKEPDDWDPAPSPRVRDELLRRLAETYPRILLPSPPGGGGGGGEGPGMMTVIRDIVGRRPTRKGGPRVAGEVLPEAGFVMHAYGLGGRGYELSWGVAEAVVEGVEKALKGGQPKL